MKIIGLFANALDDTIALIEDFKFFETIKHVDINNADLTCTIPGFDIGLSTCKCKVTTEDVAYDFEENSVKFSICIDIDFTDIENDKEGYLSFFFRMKALQAEDGMVTDCITLGVSNNAECQDTYLEDITDFEIIVSSETSNVMYTFTDLDI